MKTAGTVTDNSQSMDYNSEKMKVKLLTCFFLFFGLLKLFLVRESDIIAAVGPYDQQLYARLAESILEGNWFGEYNETILIRMPVYPLWIAFTNMVGIPLRLAIELLLIGATITFCYSLHKTQWPFWVIAGIYITIIFLPHSFVLNEQLRAASLYVPLLLLSLAGMILMISTIDTEQCVSLAVFMGIVTGLLWFTRKEYLLIMLYMGCYVLLTTVYLYKNKSSIVVFRKKLLYISLIPLSIIFAISLTFRSINYFNYGSFVVCELLSPGFTSANKALMRIETNDVERYVSVLEEARREAYTVSSGFGKLQQYLEKNVKDKWTGPSCRKLGICNDYANGWFIFALREAAAKAGFHESSSKAEKFYNQIAYDINEACNTGELECRTVWFDYLHPVPKTYLSYLPSSFIKIVEAMMRNPIHYMSGDLPFILIKQYDKVANRRAPKSNNAITEISGWVLSIENPITSVLLLDDARRVIGSTSDLYDRRGVQLYFEKKKNMWVPLKTGFRIRIDSAIIPGDPDKMQLLFLSGQQVFKGTFINKRIGNFGGLYYRIDSMERIIPDEKVEKKMEV